MNQDALFRAFGSNQALFRYRMVCEVLTRVARGEPRADAVRYVTAHLCVQLDGAQRKLSTRTMYRWLHAFEQNQLSGLEPTRRTQASTALSDAFIAYLLKEKKDDPRASVPQLILRAREHGVLQSRELVDRSTVWRALKRLRLPTRRRPSKREGDMRRFAYPHRMQMVLCDGKHFRVGPQRIKRVTLNFIDDSTRRGLRARVGSSESTELFLLGLYEVIERYGLMDAVYIDHGPGFASDDTARVLAQLKIKLILGSVAYPQGHGKVERFNRTESDDLLRCFDGAEDIDPDLTALGVRVNHYYDQYNERPHESLAPDSPLQRWEADSQALRFPSDTQALRAKFVLTEERNVSNDHIIQYDGIRYEAPQGLAGQKKLLVYRQVLTGDISVIHHDRYVKLHEVDLAQNATDRRGRRREVVEVCSPVKTAATLAYERDHAVLVDADGGFEQ